MMPPKKKAAVGEASSVANKRQAASVRKVAAAKKRQGGAQGTPKEQAEEVTAAAGSAAPEGLLGALATEGSVAGSPGKGEGTAVVARDVGFDGAAAVASLLEEDPYAAAEVERTEDVAAAAAAAVTADGREAPAGTVVDAAASRGETGRWPRKEGVNGSVEREEAAAVAVKMELDGKLNAAAVATSALPDKEQDADLEAEKAEEAAASAATVECGDAGTEMVEDAAAEGAIAGSQVEEEKVTGFAAAEEAAGVGLKMEADDEASAFGQEELATAGPPSSSAATIAFPLASLVAELPVSLPLQMGPPFLSMVHSVDELRGLSKALSAFICCWDELCRDLDSIHFSMNTLSRVRDACPLPTLAPEGEQRQEKMEEEADKKEDAAGKAETEEKDGKDTDGAEQANQPGQPQKTPLLDLNSICEKMLGRNLRRYVVAHMSDVDRLREEVPKALRLAPDPAKLVLSCIGRFYLQGSRAYGDPNSPMVCVRRACILVLEFFILSGCPFSGSVHLSSSSSDSTITDSAPTDVAEGKESSTSVMEEAKVAALAWKNRLVAEGGVATASAVDALGLALFVASFGIPSDFDSEMIYEVFRLCNMKKKADILRQSPIIMENLPGIIEDLVQKEKHIAAADLACSFGLQEKYPPLNLISSFLIKRNVVANEERGDGQGSMRPLRETTGNQLAAYKSVVKCLEDHKLDPSSLASFKIEEIISKLEKDMEKFDKKLKDKNLKRKTEDVDLTNGVKPSGKRPAATPAKATSGSHPSWVKHSQDHGRTLSLKNLYAGSSERFSGLVDGSGAGNLAGKVLGPTGAGVGLATTAGLFAGSGYSVGNGIRCTAESSGVSYRWYQEGALGGDSSIGRSYVGMGHSGQKGLIGPSPTENLLRQLPASPVGMGIRATGSSLYGFADNVRENELYHSRSARSNVLSNSALGYHSAYLN